MSYVSGLFITGCNQYPSFSRTIIPSLPMSQGYWLVEVIGPLWVPHILHLSDGFLVLLLACFSVPCIFYIWDFQRTKGLIRLKWNMFGENTSQVRLCTSYCSQLALKCVVGSLLGILSNKTLSLPTRESDYPNFCVDPFLCFFHDFVT